MSFVVKIAIALVYGLVAIALVGLLGMLILIAIYRPFGQTGLDPISLGRSPFILLAALLVFGTAVAIGFRRVGRKERKLKS